VGAASAVTTGRAVKLTVRTRSAHRSDIEQAVTERVTQALTAGNVSIISFAVARRALSPTTVSRACLVLVGVAGVIMTSEQDGGSQSEEPAGGSTTGRRLLTPRVAARPHTNAGHHQRSRGTPCRVPRLRRSVTDVGCCAPSVGGGPSPGLALDLMTGNAIPSPRPRRINCHRRRSLGPGGRGRLGY